MGKYRVLFENKILKSVNPTKAETPANDTILEKTTGSVIWAIIEAESDDEAQQKAERLETELQTGQTKETLQNKENATG